MLHSTFVLLFRYWRCSDQIGQWIPFTVVIFTSLHTCTLKVTSAIVTIHQSLSNLRTVKMILGASRLFLVYLPAISQTWPASKQEI
jgi:hypothetical protein